jgi:hypothetical protein
LGLFVSSQNVDLVARKATLEAIYEEMILRMGSVLGELDKIHMLLKYLNTFSKGLQQSHAAIFSQEHFQKMLQITL